MILKPRILSQEEKNKIKDKEIESYNNFKKDLIELFNKYNANLIVEEKREIYETVINIKIEYLGSELYGNLYKH